MKQVYWENKTNPLLRKHDGKDGHWAGMSNLQWFAAFYGYTGHFDDTVNGRVADVGGPRDRRSPKGQSLLRKEGPPTYAILSQNLILSRFPRLMNGHHRAFYKSHPTLGVFSTKVS